MVSNDTQSVNDYLTDLSPTDKPWDTHKSDGVQIANALSMRKEFAKRAYNLNECAEWLLYNFTDDLDKPFKLSKSNFCRDRACPVCQWRRSLRWSAIMHQQMPVVVQAYPTHRWIFATFTVRNCAITELKLTIKAMNKAFTALVRKLKKRLGEVGYIKTVEVTRANNDTAHPHFHVMFLVPSDYFRGRGYIKQAEWVELWAVALGIDYKPLVDVRAIKPKMRSTGSYSDAVASAMAETVKYAVKPSDLLRNGDYGWLYEYLRQAQGMRFLSVGGVLKGLIKAEWQSDEEDLVHVGDDEQSACDEKTQIVFSFDRFVWRYKV